MLHIEDRQDPRKVARSTSAPPPAVGRRNGARLSRVLVIHTDIAGARLVQEAPRMDRFELTPAIDLRQAMAELAGREYDCVVLDEDAAGDPDIDIPDGTPVVVLCGTRAHLRSSAARYRDHLATSELGTSVLARTISAAIDRAQARATLATTEAQHRAVVGALAEAQALAHLGSWEWSLEDHAVRWSPELYRIFGQDPAEFVPTYSAFLACIDPEDRSEVDRTVASAVRDGAPYRCRYRVIRASGERRWVESKGAVGAGPGRRYVGTVLDVTERHHAGLALRESEERYRTIVETAREGVWVVDADNRTTFTNERMASLLGRTVAEMAGSLLFDHIDAAERDACARRVSSRRGGVSEQIDCKLIRKDGSELWTVMETGPLYDGDGRYVGALAMVTDITERHQAQQQLRFQARLLDTVGEAVVATDPFGVVTYWGPGAVKLYGWTAEEALGRDILALTGTSTTWSDGAQIMDALAEGALWTGILQLRRRDRSTFLAEVTATPLDDEGRIVGIISISSDVTDREQSKARLEHLVAERTAGAAAQAAIVALGRVALAGSPARDVVDAALETVVRTLGVERSALFTYGGPDRGLVPEATHNGDPSCAASPVPVPVTVTSPDSAGRLTDVDGGGVWAAISVRGEVFGAIVAHTDEVDRIFTEHDLSFLASVANVIGSVVEREDLDRLKSQFVSTVSHELRTPVTSILGYLELIRGGEVGDVSPDQAWMLDAIDRNGKRLRSLIEDLLTAARIEAGALTLAMAPVDVASLVEAAVQAAAPALAGRNVEMVIDVDAGLPPVTADAEQLERAVVNLLTNAVKFTSDGGRVAVTARTARETIELMVEDNGVGIPENEQARLFSRFFRASTAHERAVQGTGLGLSIVRAIVERHNGTIAIRSSPNVGTTAQITLPACASST